MFIKDPAVRVYIYGICVAVGAVAVIYGLLNTQQLGGWIALVGAILGTTNTLALGNVNKPSEQAPED